MLLLAWKRQRLSFITTLWLVYKKISKSKILSMICQEGCSHRGSIRLWQKLQQFPLLQHQKIFLSDKVSKSLHLEAHSGFEEDLRHIFSTAEAVTVCCKVEAYVEEMTLGGFSFFFVLHACMSECYCSDLQTICTSFLNNTDAG